jgi:Leucine-rich repeat (LRR) protein
MKPNIITKLPIEMVNEICMFLNTKTVITLSTVNKFFFNIYLSEFIWKLLMTNDYKKVEYIPTTYFKTYKFCYVLPKLIKIFYCANDIRELHNLDYNYLVGRNSKELLSYKPTLTHLLDTDRLTLGNKLLKKIPKEISTLEKLEVLYLNNNYLEYMPEKIWTLTKLSLLNLRNNDLSKISEKICELTNLYSLDLGHNTLSNIPECFGNLNNLQILKLDQNKLVHIPESFKQLTNLRVLDLMYNKLTELPELCPKLEIINLISNKLTVPPKVKHCSFLQSLNLVYNPLIKLNPEIRQMYFSDDQGRKVLSHPIQKFYDL